MSVHEILDKVELRQLGERFEAELRSLFNTQTLGTPPALLEAMQHAVFPGGSRMRPYLTLACANRGANSPPPFAFACAAAVELIHCASLVHDDLPCFDDAWVRRGRPSVHAAFGEATALLAGDALIVLAFQVLADGRTPPASMLGPAVSWLARGTGVPNGIVAGQARDSDGASALVDVHRAKTAALFECACALGAVSVGVEPEPYRRLGELVGRALQLADDIGDVIALPMEHGKPSQADARNQRPNAATEIGVRPCQALVVSMLNDARHAMPPHARGSLLEAALAEIATLVRRRAGLAEASEEASTRAFDHVSHAEPQSA